MGDRYVSRGTRSNRYSTFIQSIFLFLFFFLSFFLSFCLSFFPTIYHPFFLLLIHSFILFSHSYSYSSLYLHILSLFLTSTFTYFMPLISQLVHMKPLLAHLLMTRMALAECLTLYSAISTAVEQRNITATSTKIISKLLGSLHSLFIALFFTLLQSILCFTPFLPSTQYHTIQLYLIPFYCRIFYHNITKWYDMSDN